jgi:single-stranded-DNA-specific exonuclease
VIGIVASRLVERYHRPVVLIAGAEGAWKGSGRSVPAFDLHAALGACAGELERFGGHRAAAGLSLRAAHLDAFREAFVAHAAATLDPADLRRTERIDAMVGGTGLGLDLAEELGQLAPFGMGNPGVRLLVPAAQVSDVRTMGEGKHARFSLHSGGHRALGVAFGRSSLGVGDEDRVDAAVRLEVNHWNGATEPRVVLRELYPLADGGDGEGAAGTPLHACLCEESEWWRRFEIELGGGAPAGGAGYPTIAQETRPGAESRTVVGGAGSATARIAELVSSGAGVLAVCADASRRAALATGAAGLARFNGGAGRIACARCGGAALEAVLGRACDGLALTDYATLERPPAELAAHFEHVVLVDPPPSAPAERTAVGPCGERQPGFLHPLWTDAEREFALAVHDEQYASRGAVAAVFRALREAGEVSGPALRRALAGAGSHPLPPEAAARCFRVLAELELVAGEPAAGAGAVGVVSSEGTELERSTAFRAYRRDHSEASQYLARPKQQ